MAKYEIKDGVGIIPEGTTEIESKAFFGEMTLKSVVIPDSVTSIGMWAFSECANLISIDLPESVTKIQNYAFAGCSKLETITIGKFITAVYPNSFSACPSLKSIVCKAESPDQISTISKEDLGGYHAVLYVPENAVELYKKKLPWKKFRNILPIGSAIPANTKESKYLLEWQVSNTFFQIGELQDIQMAKTRFDEKSVVGFHDDISSEKNDLFKWTTDYMNVIMDWKELGVLRAYKLDKAGKYNESKPSCEKRFDSIGLFVADMEPEKKDYLQSFIAKSNSVDEGKAIAIGGYMSRWDRQQMSCVIDVDGKFEPANLFLIKSKVINPKALLGKSCLAVSWDEIGYANHVYCAELGDDMGQKDVQEIIGYAEKINGQFIVRVWQIKDADWKEILSKVS